MAVFNHSTRELTTKIVYYGPGLCGKTTNLEFIYENLPEDIRGKMLSLATKSDRTLFFDFLPIDLGEIQGMKTKVQLYTVPGQVFYNETRRLVLKGADGIVFVADSQEDMLDANLDSYKNLEENLAAHGESLEKTPHVLQFNKQDLPEILDVDVLNEKLNHFNAPFYEAIATTGIGVQETLRHISKLVLLALNEKYGAEGVELPAASEAVESAPAAERHEAPEVAAAAPDAGPLEDVEPAAAAAASAPFDLDIDAPAAPLDATPFASVADDEDVFGLGVGTPSPVFAAPAPQHVGGGETEVASVEASVIEVSGQDALFQEPGVEPTRLDGTSAHEILVPLEVDTPEGLKRYRLKLRVLSRVGVPA